MVNQIIEKISCLSARFLSYDGCVVLIKSVLEAMTSYWPSFFVLPKSISKEVDKRCCDFLWGVIDHKKVPFLN